MSISALVATSFFLGFVKFANQQIFTMEPSTKTEFFFSSYCEAIGW